MRRFTEDAVWRAGGVRSELEGVSGQIGAAEALFPDDERFLERFNLGPETEELCQELTYALREVGRFLSSLMVVPAAPESRL
jgi:hypothetical protein